MRSFNITCVLEVEVFAETEQEAMELVGNKDNWDDFEVIETTNSNEDFEIVYDNIDETDEAV